MFVGIDIGGTFCDCVTITDGKLVQSTKVPTNKENLLETLTQTLQQLSKTVNPHQIQRITVSTTLITNQIVAAKMEPAVLIALPGPGLKLETMLPESMKTFCISGSVDHQGTLVQAVNPAEVQKVADMLQQVQCYRVAVVAKFGNRNACLEHQVKELLLAANSMFEVTLGSELSGRLNFPRRCQGSYLTAATSATFQSFLADLTKVISELGITAPLYIMKADGGSLPAAKIKGLPLETIFSGPAASALGAASLMRPNKVGIIADVGGTTTDLALVLDGEPLISSKGASIGHFRTLTRCFAVTSIALGGDSAVRVKDGVQIGPDRLGPARCFGGPALTATDIFNYLDLVNVGEKAQSITAVEALAKESNIPPRDIANQAIATFGTTFVKAVEQMLQSWEQEPVYHVWRLLAQNQRPTNIIAIGGGGGLLEALAEQLPGFTVVRPPSATIANAIGAAITQPIAKLSMRIDTIQGLVQIEETGDVGQLASEDITAVALAKASSYADDIGLKNIEPCVVEHESFNQIRDGRRLGEVHYLTVQTPWRLLPLKGAECDG